MDGEPEVKIHGQWVPVRAAVRQISGLSAHADADELIVWMRRRERDPEAVYLIHGEYSAQQVFAERLADEFGWRPQIPDLGDTIEVS